MSYHSRFLLGLVGLALFNNGDLAAAAEMAWGTGIHGEALSAGQLSAATVSSPVPVFSPRLLRSRPTGYGIFELLIDPKTGRVKDVRVVVSTKNALLDEELAAACRNYRYKHGVITAARIPMGFGNVPRRSTGASKWVL